MLARALGDSWSIARHLWDGGRSNRAQVPPEEVGAIDGASSDRLPAGQAGNRACRVHLFFLGTASAGKSSLVEALIRRSEGQIRTPPVATGPRGLSTREIQAAEGSVVVTDTPGLFATGGLGAEAEEHVNRLALEAHLLFFVVERDLRRMEIELVSSLLAQGKRLLVVLNKKDLVCEPDLGKLLARLRGRLAGIVPPENVVAVAARPDPVNVRVRDSGGSERSILEYEEPDLTALEERIEAIVAGDPDALSAASILLCAHRLRKSEQEQARRERRRRSEAIIERYQWMACTAAVAVPLPHLDMMATGAVEYQMISEIAAVHGADLSAEHVRLISQQMIQTLLKRRVVESALTLVSGALKSSLIGYAAGGLIQAATVAYLTRVTGLTFLDYFERGQDWGEGGIQSALARQVDQNSRSDVIFKFVQNIISNTIGCLSGLARVGFRGGQDRNPSRQNRSDPRGGSSARPSPRPALRRSPDLPGAAR